MAAKNVCGMNSHIMSLCSKVFVLSGVLVLLYERYFDSNGQEILDSTRGL